MKILLKIIKWILIGTGGLAGIFFLYLLVIGLVPGITAPKQPLPETGGEGGKKTKAPYRADITFTVKGARVHGWFYLPDNRSAPAPCVVMAHGLGGIKDMGLDRDARLFQREGYAVLAFDYRYWGDSGGEPRHLIWIPDQHEDNRGAVAWARGRNEIDPGRIILWGTSFSGGHAIVIGAEDSRVAAVVAQVPQLDGRETMELEFENGDLSYALRMVMHGQRDLVRSWFGLPPHTIPLIGKPGTVAIYTDEDHYDFFVDQVPGNFPNKACARIVIRGDKYRPITVIDKINCPVLIQSCVGDIITPPNALARAKELLGDRGEFVEYGFGHFDIYTGSESEKSMKDQVAFLKKHIPANR